MRHCTEMQSRKLKVYTSRRARKFPLRDRTNGQDFCNFTLMSRREKTVWVAFALACLAYALVLYRELFPHFASTMVGFGNGDPNQAAWFLANTAHAIKTLSNPFVSHLINYPYSANMMANTSTIAVGALFAPVTLAWGPIVALNIVFITGIAATTWSYAFVARRFGMTLPVALLVGVLIGFAPIRMIHGQGQPFLIFAVGTPWMLYSIWKLVEGHATGPAAMMQSVFWVVWSALVSLERLFIIGVPIAVYIAIRTWQARHSENFHERLKVLSRFALLCAVFLSWPLYEFQFGEQSLHGPPHDWLMGYSSHLRDFVAAGPWMLWNGLGPSDHNTGFLSGNFIDASYIGFPVLAAFLWGAWRLRNRFAIRCLTLAAVGGLILSCGLEIAWTDRGWSFPGAYAVLQHLPGFSSAHPLNFQIVSSIAMAFVIGFAIDDCLKSRPRRQVPLAIVSVILVLSIAPNQVFSTTKVELKSWYGSAEGKAVVPNGSVVLTYPYSQNIINGPMLDQAVAGMRFRLIGGQVTVPNPHGRGQSVRPLAPRGVFDIFAHGYLGQDLLSLYNVPVGPMPERGVSTTAMLRAFVRTHDVDVIVMEFSGADPLAVVQRLNDAFGKGNVRRESNLIWWKVGTSAE